MIEPGIEVDMRELGRAFGALESGVRRRVARKVTNFAMTTTLKDARNRIQRRTGFTASSLKKKTKVYQGGEVSVTLVGIDRKAAILVNGRRHQPAVIEHILSEGYINAKSGRFVPGSRFAVRALEAKSPDVRRRTLQKLAREIDKEVMKARGAA